MIGLEQVLSHGCQANAIVDLPSQRQIAGPIRRNLLRRQAADIANLEVGGKARDLGRSKPDCSNTSCCGLEPWMPAAEPTSMEPGSFFTCISRNEYEPRSRQKFMGRHSDAISPPSVVAFSPFPNQQEQQMCRHGINPHNCKL